MSFIVVRRDRIVPNRWNPNVMSPFMYAKELDSIREFGLIDPVLVREVGIDRYQIIDGEHRWRAAGDLGIDEVPVWNLGLIDDATAKRLTITMNELRGQSDPAKMSSLLDELAKLTPIDELAAKLPFTNEYFTAMTGLPKLAPLGATPPGPSPFPASDPASGAGGRRWVERTYRLPPEAAEVLDEALAVARDQAGEDVADHQALEFIAAEFLATYRKVA